MIFNSISYFLPSLLICIFCTSLTLNAQCPTATGDQTSYGTNSWIGYVYEGTNTYNTSNYQGTITETALAFDQSFCGSNCDIVADAVCNVNTETFSVRYKNRQNLACGLHTFTIGSDYGVRFSINGGGTYLISANQGSGYVTRDVTVFLTGGDYELVLDYFHQIGVNRVSVAHSVVTGSYGGEITGDQTICENTIDPVAFTSVSPARFCSEIAASYQWEESPTGSDPWTPIPSATGITYDIPSGLAAGTHYYRRRATDGISTTLYSNVISVVAEVPLGDQVSFGAASWTGYAYDGADNYTSTDYLGYYDVASLNFAETFASVTLNGCSLPTEDFTISYKRSENIATCGGYNITIGAEGGGVRLYTDGELVIDGYSPVVSLTTYSANVFLSAGDHLLTLDYFNSTGANTASFSMTAAPETGGGGVIASDQSVCVTSYDPDPFTSILEANFCSGSFTYQWESAPTAGGPWIPIPGAVNEVYDESLSLGAGSYYYRRTAIDGVETAYSNIVVIEVSSPQGDEVSTPPAEAWRPYVYQGSDISTATYLGYLNDITTPGSFDVNFTCSACDVAINGCDLKTEDFSARFRSLQTVACGGYDITIGAEGGGVRLYVDGNLVIDGNAPNTTYTTYTENVFLDGSTEFAVEYYNVSGANRVTLSLTGPIDNGSGGVIGSNQDICEPVVNPVAFTSLSEAGFCSGATSYQWQESPDGIDWMNIPGAMANTYDIPPGLLAGNHYYRRQATNGSLIFYSNVVLVSASSPVGDGVTFGTDQWIGYVYDNEQDFVNDFMGSITQPTNFDLTFCGSNCNYSINGCSVLTETFSIHFKNRTSFACGSYQLTIGGDDGVALDVDGVNVINALTRQLYTTYRTTQFFDGTGTTDLELLYSEWMFSNRVSFNTVYLGPGNAGQIGSDQYNCQSSVTPGALISVEDAFFCSGSTPTYQWQESLDGLGWSNITGETSATYTPSAPVSATTYYRRQASADGYTLNSNVITVELDPPQGDRVTYGNNAWIGYVYDNFQDVVWNPADYLGYIEETTIFSESFCGSDCTFPITGCDVNTESFSIQFLNEMTLECGYYEISITFKDGARLFIDDAVVPGLNEYWIHAPVTTLTETVYLAGPSHQFRLEYREDSFNNIIGFDMQYLGAGIAGVVGSDQVFCSPSFDPLTMSGSPPNFTCSGDLSPNYQWQISSNGTNWSDILGATAASYNPPAGQTATRYYRRKETDNLLNILYSNVLTVLYDNSDPPTHTGTEYGTAPEWIGHVYDGVYDAPGNFANYQGSFIETMIGNAFDESFCGDQCIFPIDGCDISTTTFTVQFRTRIDLPSGSYTFTIGSDAGAQLSIDGGATYLIDDYDHAMGHGYRTASNPVPVDLPGGTYELVLDYFDNFTENRVTFSYTSVPLLVTWYYFDGYYENGTAFIEWWTASEINNEGFEVERSVDGKNFEQIGWVPGHGTTNEEQRYLFTDDAPQSGWNYYRLKQIDFDRAFEYSRFIPVYVDDLPRIEIYPNPFHDHLYLSRIKKDVQTEVILINLLGQQSWSLNQDPMQPARFVLPARLEPGYYTVRIRLGNETIVRKVMIE